MVTTEAIRTAMRDISDRHLDRVQDPMLKVQYESYIYFALKAAILGEDTNFAWYRASAETDIMFHLEQKSDVLRTIDAIVPIVAQRLRQTEETI